MALIAVLSVAAVSCQKETMIEPQNVVAEDVTVYTVRYTINGVPHTERLNTSAEYDALLLQLFALAREGYEVEIMGGDSTINEALAKEVVTFTTKKEAEATAWSKQKVDEGYTVHISYNQATGVYTCIAYR